MATQFACYFAFYLYDLYFAPGLHILVILWIDRKKKNFRMFMFCFLSWCERAENWPTSLLPYSKKCNNFSRNVCGTNKNAARNNRISTVYYIHISNAMVANWFCGSGHKYTDCKTIRFDISMSPQIVCVTWLNMKFHARL